MLEVMGGLIEGGIQQLAGGGGGILRRVQFFEALVDLGAEIGDDALGDVLHLVAVDAGAPEHPFDAGREHIERLGDDALDLGQRVLAVLRFRRRIFAVGSLGGRDLVEMMLPGAGESIGREGPPVGHPIAIARQLRQLVTEQFVEGAVFMVRDVVSGLALRYGSGVEAVRNRGHKSHSRLSSRSFPHDRHPPFVGWPFRTAEILRIF